METRTSRLAPVRKSVRVQWDARAAFDRFTRQMSSWWPLATHSVGGAETVSVTMEGRESGAIYEVQRDGTRSEWGTVTVWNPPTAVSFTWHPGRAADGAQLVEVTFCEKEDGTTEVVLVHSGWESLGERGDEIREQYVGGWEGVLALYAGVAS